MQSITSRALALGMLLGAVLALGSAFTTAARAADPHGYAGTTAPEAGIPVPTRAFGVDVVQNMTEFYFEGDVNENGMPAKGTPFVTSGYIYPAGTLDAYGSGSGITPAGEPEFPELVLGVWTCRGWHLQDGDAESGVVVVTSQTFDFATATPGSQMLVTTGIELAEFGVPFKRAITGGTGVFAGSDGEMQQTYLDGNASGGFNMTFRRLPPR